jgi:carbon-monoxide dehydrogenase medium subunit
LKTLKPFAYHTPETVKDAAGLLEQYGGTAKVFAGGTDIMVMLRDRIISVDNIIDIKKIPGLRGIEWNPATGLHIGALTTITDIVESAVVLEKYPSLKKSAEVLGSPQVRNKATIGGNICRSSPSADTPPSLIAFDAVVTIGGVNGERTVPIGEFFTGPGRNVLDKELVTGITLPAIKGAYGTAFGKISRVSEDLSKVNCAVVLKMTDKTCSDIRVVLGAVGATPVRAKNVEGVLRGQVVTDELIEKAADKVTEDIKPIDDIRSTAAYRNKVGRVLIKRLVKEALEDCGVK